MEAPWKSVTEDIRRLRAFSATTFVTKAARLHSPKHLKRHREAMSTAIRQIVTALHEQGGDARLLVEYTEECFAFAYYAGVRRGYELREAVADSERLNAEDPKDAKVLHFLVNAHNPYESGRKRLAMTAPKLVAVMDESRIPVPTHRTWAANGGRWTDLFERDARTRNAIETYLSRLKKDARNIRLAQQWGMVLRKGRRLSARSKNTKPPAP